MQQTPKKKAQKATSPNLAHDREEKDKTIPQLARRIRDKRETWVVHLNEEGRPRKVTLGLCSAIPLTRARTMAQDLLASMHSTSALLSTATLSTFSKVFLEDCAGRWKASTLRSHTYCLSTLKLTNLWLMKITDITRDDVKTWFNGLEISKGARNRSLSVLSSLMVHAEIRGLRPPGSNPCKGMRRHDLNFKAIYLDSDGFAALGRAFEKFSKSYPTQINILRFCTLTGCRNSEVLAIKWSMIDGKRIALPDSKSGPKSIWLGKPVRKLLASIPNTSEFVFAVDGRPISKERLQRVWGKVRVELKTPKLRIHDLRHSFASVALEAGYDLQVVGGLLGHSDKGSTAGYAHLDTPAIAAASARVGKHLAKVVKGRKAAKPKKPLTRYGRGSGNIASFMRSKDNFMDFCRNNDLDPKTFRRDLIKWRKEGERAAR